MVDKISIIIPAYIDSEEKQQWLNEAIQSSLNQTYPNKEVVVIDDNSPIPVKYNKAIRLNRNVGPSVARNTAVHYSTGNLIFPLDSDDFFVSDNALELLYNEYKPDKFVYGNVTIYRNNEPWKTTNFPDFQCRNILNLNGALPVSCLHSKDAHIKTGGWKSILKHGLEDVEYWISMVRQCILGVNIHEPIIYYRSHENSRSRLLEKNNQKGKTQSIIRKLHEDLYGGIMPCSSGCGGCGGRKRTNVKPNNNTQIVSTQLNDYPDTVKMAIEYLGGRKGTFGIVGKSGISYRIGGTGFKFPILKDDWDKFRNLDGGKSFRIVENLPVEIKEEKEYNPGIPEIADTQKSFSLSQLKMSDGITNLLETNNWSLEKIATESRVGDLKKIPGIGPSTELKIMEKAKEIYYK